FRRREGVRHTLAKSLLLSPGGGVWPSGGLLGRPEHLRCESGYRPKTYPDGDAEAPGARVACVARRPGECSDAQSVSVAPAYSRRTRLQNVPRIVTKVLKDRGTETPVAAGPPRGG